MHRFVTEPNRTVTLVVGAENWPFPIPLVKKQRFVVFRHGRGQNEILFRRIGRNELAAMDGVPRIGRRAKTIFAPPAR